MTRTQKGITLAECLVTLGILSSLLVVSFPLYKNNSEKRSAEAAASYLVHVIHERKERAVALGANAGLCFGSGNQVSGYEYHPFSNAVIRQSGYDFNRGFGNHVSLQIATTSNPPSTNPCWPEEVVVSLSPRGDSAEDWKGRIDVRSGYAHWYVTSEAGKLTDAP